MCAHMVDFHRPAGHIPYGGRGGGIGEFGESSVVRQTKAIQISIYILILERPRTGFSKITRSFFKSAS